MIVIIGTGLSGLATAAALGHAGFDVALVGPQPKTNQDGRTTAILAPHVTFLKTIGAWPSRASSATALTVMELVHDADMVRFDCTEMGLAEFGYNVSNADLTAALVARIKKTSGITWHSTSMTQMTRTTHGWTVTLKNGKKIDATLVIGADGRQSSVRGAAGIDIDERAENQSALVVNLAIEKPHRHVTVERYRAGGPFTLVPAAGNSMALVWCDTDAVIDDWMTRPMTELGAHITTLSEGRFGRITPVTPPQKWPIRPLKAHHMVAAHTALVGEAAHTLPPIGAQGFNTSIADIIALCDMLERGRDYGLASGNAAMLRLYDRARRADVAMRYHGITLLNDMIRTQNPAFAKLRSLSLRILGTLSPIRRPVMRLGLGAARAS